MFGFEELSVPLVAAPMAGGPSTPELVAAVSDAGGFGFLAAGYLTPAALGERIEALRAASGAPFGVNVFVPGAPGDTGGLAGYRARLAPAASRFGVELGDARPDDDAWDAKLDLLCDARVAVVSFTFGLPPAEVVARLRGLGTAVVASVASVADAEAAAALGVAALAVQGAEAGGHRATIAVDAEPNELGTLELLRRVRARVRLPLIAAGGIADGRGVAAAVRAGAVGVQLGTAYLRTPEAGTSAVHRAALADPRFTSTVVTRAFTGRPARSLANAFAALGPDAPAAYPAVHQLTRPLRAAAAGAPDADWVHLWAGTGWAQASEEPAASLTRRLWGEAEVA